MAENEGLDTGIEGIIRAEELREFLISDFLMSVKAGLINLIEPLSTNFCDVMQACSEKKIRFLHGKRSY